ncbi:S8 family peptidase [Stenotrophomonas sp. C3(2023)]|uniref:S8 family peptidase n=1 Tax=Stenotrophomonas sp. C3(2023) TaxID=3080277 RepID=UPI00293C2008|nr:S8 family peptidase [Stenotrophomonas sp. C3(2023)]MDV3469359.1 S8 family peptidase [Stenotrophomonas sp. C3(2023)]
MNSDSLCRSTLLASALALCLAGSAAAATALGPVSGPLHAPTVQQPSQRLIVKFRAGTAAAATPRQAQLALAAALQGKAVGTLRAGALTLTPLRRTATGADVVKASGRLRSSDMDAVLRVLRADPNVEYAQVDRRMYALQRMPNDPQLPVYQWDMLDTLGGIYAPRAWEQTRGEGIVVAVLDTGVLPHVDLKANLVPGYDMVSSYGQDADSPDVAVDGDGRDPDPTDPGDWSDGTLCEARPSTWHGTHVAGTVAAVGDNGIGLAGGAYAAKVQPVRVLGRCGGFVSDIADGIIWASGGHVDGVPDNATPAEVINLSLGGVGSCAEDPLTQEAINQARSRGTTIVVAAGNNSADVSRFSPASCKGVIAVGATAQGGGLASYSNFGPGVTLAAPGGDLDRSIPVSLGVIWSLGDGGQSTAAHDDLLLGKTGTSMAAPHVAAVAALVQAAAVQAGRSPLTPDQVSDVLVRSVRPFPRTIPADRPIGAGLVDAYRAVQLAIGNALPDLPKPVLQSGVALTGQNGAQGQRLVYTLEVPAAAGSLNVRTLGGNGAVSLEAAPPAGAAVLRSTRPGTVQAISVRQPAAGTWTVTVEGQSRFGDVSVLGIVR